ncbi:diaminopimelate decarboxylase [Nocardia macrotermitis]|uniref:Diaminopimelate decarboxylase n=1 Tax=Nocardia macrotermitis TaxID=2585198 RepID=A0A7K0D3E7_9NOCA|nr:diaminopimelate decarboxylase [Nocardia macrotermitis]MQY20238.1 Diaminopimelate decarboxylase [Nocardia macrotermitis]
MTLLEIFPSLRSGMPSPRLDATLWPCETHYDDLGRITVGGVALADIADQYGTPVYVLDESEVRRRCRAYRKYFPDAEIVYAAKALLTKSVAGWVAEEGLSVDVCSAGELVVALAAGVDPARIVLHGSGKPFAELEAAVHAGVGRIVIDSLTEITLLAAVATRPQQVLLRLSPDIDVHGHPAVKTGVADQKFGFPLGSAAALDAIDRVMRQPMLDLVGLHCHLGSQIHDPDFYGEAVRRLIAEMSRIRTEYGRTLPQLDLGGGHAVAYRCGDAEMNLPELADILEDALDAACALNHFPRLRISLEPGRAIVAHAGVTLYRVMAIKHVEGGRTFVIADGGMNDNPRVALYGARYDAVVANRHPTGPHLTATVAGRYCEAGDILAADVRLPADLRPGEVLAVPCTGAYHHSLASTYNGVGRPPIISVRNGRCHERIRRETPADLLARDLG